MKSSNFTRKFLTANGDLFMPQQTAAFFISQLENFEALNGELQEYMAELIELLGYDPRERTEGDEIDEAYAQVEMQRDQD